MRIGFFRSFLGIATVFLFFLGAYGQDTPPQTNRPVAEKPPGQNAQQAPVNLLRQLGLSPDQVQQMRKINLERRPLLNEAQRRFREANRSLDEAIYADRLDENEIDARLKEVQATQAELAKVRYANELAVRRILTPEQLIHFRDLRLRFEQQRKDRARAAAGQGNVPVKPVNGRPFRNQQRPRPLVRPAQQHP
jgi:Spy/CpxP family protein refolding chaperone